MKRLRGAIAISFFLLASNAYAAPPMVEFYLTKYRGRDCLQRAENALNASGFLLKGGTYQGEDRVGTRGNYKGVVGCSIDFPDTVVFIVSGPNYAQADSFARLIQANFLAGR